MIFGRQPAVWIGIIVSLIVGVLTTLSGNGLISDALKGQVTNIVNATAQLATLLAPVIAGLLIKGQVTPVIAPVLPIGTTVNAGTVDVARVKAA